MARHQRWRARERTMLATLPPEGLDAHLPFMEQQVSNVWSMGEDGRSWPATRPIVVAERIAQHKGCNPKERAALKERFRCVSPLITAP